MRLGYFTMPLHPVERNPTETLQEDREAIILADKLGFHDAFVGEHLTEKTENIPSSMLFLATLISDTKTIKLAHRHLQPLAVASGADRVARRDVRSSRQRPLHLRHQRRRARVRRRSARQPERRPQQDVRRGDRRHPRDLGARFAVRHRFPGQPLQGVGREDRAICRIGRGHLYKPYQKPRPEIVGTVVAPLLERRDRDGRARLPSAVGQFPALDSGCPATGRTTPKANARPARPPNPRTGASRARSSSRTTTRSRGATAATIADSPYRYYWNMLLYKMMLGEAAGRVQDRSVAARLRPHRGLHPGQPGDPRHGRTRSSTRS